MGLTQWTDPTITAGSTPIRKVHIDELRGAINRWRRFYGLGNRSWTDGTITAGSTGVRKVHFDEMRSELNSLNGSAFGWTDGTITASSTPVRKVHMDELRANMNWLEQNRCHGCDTCDNHGCCDSDYGCSCDWERCDCEGDEGCCDSLVCHCDHDMKPGGCVFDYTCGCDNDEGCCDSYYCVWCDSDSGCGGSDRWCSACDGSANRVANCTYS